MGILLGIVLFFGLAISLSLLLNKKSEYMFPFTASLISFVLFMSALLNHRSFGVYLLLFTLVCCVVLVIKRRVINRIIPIVQSPAFLYIAILSILAFWFTRGFVYGSWDEFSHWGLVLKNIYMSNNFGNLDTSTTYFQSYPQGVSLFISIFNQFSSDFRESNTLFGILVLSFAQMSIVFHDIKLKPIKNFILLLTCVTLAPLVFYNTFYSTIYVDAILGLVFANIIIFHFAYKNKLDFFYVSYLSLQLILLVGIKQIGLVFSCIALFVVLLDLIYQHRKELKQSINKLAVMLYPLFAFVAADQVWKLYTKSNGITDIFKQPGFSLPDIYSLFTQYIAPYRYETLVSFMNKLFGVHQFNSIGISYFALCGVILLFFASFGRLWGKKRDNMGKFLGLSLFLGFCVYTTVLLYLYLFVFWDVEARHTASFDRYISSFLISIIIVFLFYSIRLLSEVGPQAKSIFLSSVLIVIFALAPVQELFYQVIFHEIQNRERSTVRINYARVVNLSANMDRDKDRVYIISQNSNGEDYWKLRYEFTPIKVSPNYTWSLGQPYDENDIYSKTINSLEWSDQLKDYTYVYLWKVDDKFKENYGSLFVNPSDISNQTLFKTDRTGKIVTLKKVNEAIRTNTQSSY